FVPNEALCQAELHPGPDFHASSAARLTESGRPVWAWMAPLLRCRSDPTLLRAAMDAIAVTVRVPATSANLGAGFDCLGLALDLFAEITVTFSDSPLPPSDDIGERIVLNAVRTTYQKLGRPAPEGLQARYSVSIPLG